MKVLESWVFQAVMHDFLWEPDGHGIYAGKQPWKHREADDHRL